MVVKRHSINTIQWCFVCRLLLLLLLLLLCKNRGKNIYWLWARISQPTARRDPCIGSQEHIQDDSKYIHKIEKARRDNWFPINRPSFRCNAIAQTYCISPYRQTRCMSARYHSKEEIHLPFNAITLLAGFMMAESAEIGLRIGLVGSDMSMMTTWAVSPTFSRTQMYLERGEDYWKSSWSDSCALTCPTPWWGSWTQCLLEWSPHL